MKYEFTKQELISIFGFFKNAFGPVQAYRWYNGWGPSAPTVTSDVEDFACAFMSQYNKTFGQTF